MKLSELKNKITTILRERSTYKLGTQEYTKKNLTPTDILDLAMAYSQVQGKGTAMYGRKMEKMIKVGNDLVNEGKKRYYQQDRVGSAKYTISYHDGKKKHKDGSDFFDIQIFKNKKDLAKFVNTLHKGGYVYGFNESVNKIQ